MCLYYVEGVIESTSSSNLSKVLNKIHFTFWKLENCFKRKPSIVLSLMNDGRSLIHKSGIEGIDTVYPSKEFSTSLD